jgi:transcriptional regulator with PAS, ATPase and Fis domain
MPTEKQVQKLKLILKRMSYQEVKDLLFSAHLAAHDGSRREAAKSLGVSERTLYYWIKRNECTQQPPEPRGSTKPSSG